MSNAGDRRRRGVIRRPPAARKNESTTSSSAPSMSGFTSSSSAVRRAAARGEPAAEELPKAYARSRLRSASAAAATAPWKNFRMAGAEVAQAELEGPQDSASFFEGRAAGDHEVCRCRCGLLRPASRTFQTTLMSTSLREHVTIRAVAPPQPARAPDMIARAAMVSGSISSKVQADGVPAQ